MRCLCFPSSILVPWLVAFMVSWIGIPVYAALPKVILDTDIARVDEQGRSASDIDDLGALTILNALADQGHCEVLAIVTSSRSDTVVGMIDAVNTYFGNPDIPIGIKGGNRDLIMDQDSYAKWIGERFPHDQRSVDAPSATVLLRRLLSQASMDDEIIYIHGDAISNWEYLCFGELWNSPPDPLSQLSGSELVNEKIDEFCSYIPCLPNVDLPDNCPPWSDVASSDPSQLISFLSTYENTLTGNTTTPEETHVVTALWEMADSNPVKVAYEYYYTETPPPWRSNSSVPDAISLYGDPLGVFFCILKGDTVSEFKTVRDGSFYIDENKKLRWRVDPIASHHRYFHPSAVDRKTINAKLDALMTHASGVR